MKKASLIAAAAIVVLANALALWHAARNRMGSPEAEITLTERELLFYRGSGDDNSGVTLHLEWIDLNNPPAPGLVENPLIWLDQQKLQRLGFDCSVNLSGPDAVRYYGGQRARRAFVALEYDAASWRAWFEIYQRAVSQQSGSAGMVASASQFQSHLVAIDADLDSRELRARHPDRTTVLIVPAVFEVALDPYPYPGMVPDPKKPVRITGRIQQLPSDIHVPRPFSDAFRRLNRKRDGTPALAYGQTYRVTLRYGSALEPWVTGVEFSR